MVKEINKCCKKAIKDEELLPDCGTSVDYDTAECPVCQQVFRVHSDSDCNCPEECEEKYDGHCLENPNCGWDEDIEIYYSENIFVYDDEGNIDRRINYRKVYGTFNN